MRFRNKGERDAPIHDISTVQHTRARLMPFVTEGGVAALPSIVVGTAGGLWFLWWILSLPIWKQVLGGATIVSLVFLPLGIVWGEFRRRSLRRHGIKSPPKVWYKPAIGNALATLAVLIVFWYDTSGIRTTLFWGLGIQALAIPFLMGWHFRRIKRHHEGRPVIALMVIVLVAAALSVAAYFTIREKPADEFQATPGVTQVDKPGRSIDGLLVGGLVLGIGALILGARKRKL